MKEQSLDSDVISFQVGVRTHFAIATHYVKDEGTLLQILSAYNEIGPNDITCEIVKNSNVVTSVFFPLQIALRRKLVVKSIRCQFPLPFPIFRSSFVNEISLNQYQVWLSNEDGEWRATISSNELKRTPIRQTVTDVYLRDMIEKIYIDNPNAFNQTG